MMLQEVKKFIPEGKVDESNPHESEKEAVRPGKVIPFKNNPREKN